MIDYSKEQRRDIAFIDMKSFYASVECVDRGLHPLKTSLCVMSRSDNASGLILASSPTFKKVFGKQNVGRAYDLPFNIQSRKFSYYKAKRQGLDQSPETVRYIENWAQATHIVPPRMDLYIQVNLQIQGILERYAPKTEIHPYSIDEGFVDLTGALDYFVPDSKLSRKEKLDLLCARIQRDIWQETGIYATVGMSNANPLLAKLALDNEAKKSKTMRANWSYEDVKDKVWGLEKLTDFWGIGDRMAQRLNRLKIKSIRDLAHANPDLLKRELGVMGVELWFHANGVDESDLRQPYKPKSQGLGNSQVLPRDYYRAEEIEVILREMAEQVAVRLRKQGKKTRCVSLYLGYALQEEKRPLSIQRKIDPSNQTKILTSHILDLFRQKYQGGAVRQVGISYRNLVTAAYSYVTLFDDFEQVAKEEQLEETVDAIRDRFGFTALMTGAALLDASRLKARSQLIGGHSAGGLDGLQ